MIYQNDRPWCGYLGMEVHGYGGVFGYDGRVTPGKVEKTTTTTSTEISRVERGHEIPGNLAQVPDGVRVLHGHKRLTAADKQRALDALATAYANGQLTQEEHDLRMNFVQDDAEVPLQLNEILADIQVPKKLGGRPLMAPGEVQNATTLADIGKWIVKIARHPFTWALGIGGVGAAIFLPGLFMILTSSQHSSHGRMAVAWILTASGFIVAVIGGFYMASIAERIFKNWEHKQPS
jgi:hypothetical protein